MLKRGTFCYVVTTCRASPAAARAVGKIVEVMRGPYDRLDAGSPAAAYDVHYQGVTFYCHADKLRPINDPDADLDAHHDGTMAG